MNKIDVKIIEENLSGVPTFLAMLTQRGHEIHGMTDVTSLYDKVCHKPPSEALMSLPHSTIRRMNYITVAISGLSTKAVSQLRTHATRLTFISTSTQYSAFNERPDNFVMPTLGPISESRMREAYNKVEQIYDELIRAGVDKDKAGYLLPQGLRKVLIVSGNLDAWQYVMSTRLCRRNTQETQYIMQLIYNQIARECGIEYLVGCLPKCATGKCHEGKFSCGKPYEDKIYTF